MLATSKGKKAKAKAKNQKTNLVRLCRISEKGKSYSVRFCHIKLRKTMEIMEKT